MNWANLNPAWRAAIKADADAYNPLNGGPGDNPQVVDYDLLVADLTAGPPAPGLAVVPAIGCFMERLPEFLCQLGEKNRAADFM